MRQKKFYTKSVNCENNYIRCRNLLSLRSKHKMMIKFTVVVNELKQVPSSKSVHGDINCKITAGAYLGFTCSLKECHPCCVYQNYSRSMIKE